MPAFGPAQGVDDLIGVIDFVISRIAGDALHVRVSGTGGDDRETSRQIRWESKFFEPVVAELLVGLAADIGCAIEPQPQLIYFVAAPRLRVAEGGIGSGGDVGGDLFRQSSHEVPAALGRRLRDAKGKAV